MLLRSGKKTKVYPSHNINFIVCEKNKKARKKRYLTYLQKIVKMKRRNFKI